MTGLANTTFKFYTDSGLSTPFNGLYQLVHNTNLSDNPRDFQLWLGSVSTLNAFQLQASSNPGVDNITLTPTDTLPDWAVATAYTLGQSVEPTIDNTYRYECTTAGTSHASVEPTWPTTIGNTVSDGTAVWTCRSKNHPKTEIKLALTAGGLTAATGGAALSLGNTILSGVANAVEVNIRITNTVTTVGDNAGTPEFGIYNNAVSESAV